VRSTSAGKALFFSEQELALNQWVGGAASYNSRCFLAYLLTPKSRGPQPWRKSCLAVLVLAELDQTLPENLAASTWS